MGVTAGQDVLDHRAMLEQRQILKGSADADRGEAPGRDAGQIGTVKHDTAAARPQHAADHVEQRGLAGAVGADHAADFARRHGELTSAIACRPPKRLADVFDRKQRGHDSHRLAPLVVLDVAQALAARVGYAEIEFLHILVGGQAFSAVPSRTTRPVSRM